MIQLRITNPEKFDYGFINDELINGKHVIIQFNSEVYNKQMLSELNELCGQFEANFSVRFFGFYQTSFDCNTLLQLPNVKSLYVDCLLSATNTDVIQKLEKLERFWLGIHELNDTEILRFSNLKRVKELAVLETKTKALNLEYLKEYKALEYLIIGEHTKNIEAIGYVGTLKHLSLNSIKKVGISFINKLKQLKTLRIILGGRENILEIVENEIENLDIIWVRGFNDLSNIGVFKKLKTLSIEDNIQLGELNFAIEMTNLNKLMIGNCKTLSKLSGLENLTELQRLNIYKTSLDFEKLVHGKLPKSLKSFNFYTAKSKPDKLIRQKLDEMGYVQFL